LIPARIQDQAAELGLGEGMIGFKRVLIHLAGIIEDPVEEPIPHPAGEDVIKGAWLS
jgi:hypothetical protein